MSSNPNALAPLLELVDVTSKRHSDRVIELQDIERDLAARAAASLTPQQREAIDAACRAWDRELTVGTDLLQRRAVL